MDEPIAAESRPMELDAGPLGAVLPFTTAPDASPAT
jgi:hypothetical protein